MPVYNYTALKNGKEVLKGRVEASSSREARELIKQLGLIPTKIFAENAADDNKPETKKVKLKPLNMRQKIDLTNTLKILIETGVPLIEGLMFVENNTSVKNIRTLAKTLRSQIISGSTFSEALSKHPAVFDKVYIGLVSAGEASGELDHTLDRMSVLLDKQDQLKSKVTGTLIYPVFVIVLAFVIIIIMLTFVFPAFKDMYENLGAELPWITQACMDAGIFMKTYWFTIPIGFVSAFYSTYFLFTWPKSRSKIDCYTLKIPILNDFIKLAALTNFTAVMNVAYEAGIPIVDCIYLANLTVYNYPLKEALRSVGTKVQQGVHFSTALKSVDLIPPILLFMISTGEQSGRLGEMMQKASKYIDEELDRVVDALTKLVEPVMLVVIGGIVLVLALALYLPLFQAYQHMT